MVTAPSAEIPELNILPVVTTGRLSFHRHQVRMSYIASSKKLQVDASHKMKGRGLYIVGLNVFTHNTYTDLTSYDAAWENV